VELDWFWGFDVSTKAVTFAVCDNEATMFWREERPTPKALWPYYLPRISQAADRLIANAVGLWTPTVVAVEQPVGAHPNPHLVAAWGVVLERIVKLLDDVVLLDLRPQSWRRDLGMPTNATKNDVAGFAIAELGYKGSSQDEADACCIAAAGRARYRRLKLRPDASRSPAGRASGPGRS
jgi:hypothetical protein